LPHCYVRRENLLPPPCLVTSAGYQTMIREEVLSCRIGGYLPRTAPFALFMGFIGLAELTQFLASHGLFTLSETALYYLYPVKTLTVAALLLLYAGEYEELLWKDLTDWKASLAVSVMGLLTFVIWLLLDFPFLAGPSKGFNPALLPEGAVRIMLTLFRVTGAVLVVPVMEELFWRSFLIRYLVNPDFESVEIARFTWPSFLITTILFGLEHHLVVAGIVAGAIFNLILYRTRSLAQCVLAHAVTNLALACYVVYSGKWYFW
jgi:uncharacterized protein